MLATKELTTNTRACEVMNKRLNGESRKATLLTPSRNQEASSQKGGVSIRSWKRVHSSKFMHITDINNPLQQQTNISFSVHKNTIRAYVRRNFQERRSKAKGRVTARDKRPSVV